MADLISFDIDGTLEVGDPPGRITMEMVRSIKDQGHLIGSSSDRTVGSQIRLWHEHGIVVEFTVLKHRIGDLKGRFQADKYYHIGDSDMDRHFSERAGFCFLTAEIAIDRLRLGLPER